MDKCYAYKDNKAEYTNKKFHTKPVEVLAPAGSLDICKAVINAGADAVYLGGDMFGARAYAGNLNKEEMFQALDYAHRLGRHIYLTVNTLLKQNEIEGQLIDYLIPYYERGLDAVIVQDLGVMRLIRKNFPDMDIHASTQMTQTGVEGSGLLYAAGAERIVTSREMTLKEISILHKTYPDMEIESFVHGAMCYCYSGQCLMSSFNGGRSGNRGRCAQPCRLGYKVYDGEEIINSADESYALSPKDMCALKILPDIIDAGVYSLKIEGRMKNVTYAAFVTSMYRKYVDMYLDGGRKAYKVSDSDIEKLCDIYNRGEFTTGFYNSHKGSEMMALSRPNHWGVKALQVVDNVKGKVTFKALTDINAHDVFEIDKEHSFESGTDIRKGQTMIVNLPRKYNLSRGRVVSRMKNAYITEYVKDNYVDSAALVPVSMFFKAKKNEKSELTVSSGDIYVTVYGNEVQQASNQAATKDNIINKLSMTGQSGFATQDIEVALDTDVFMPVGELKRLRREALCKLEERILDAYNREYHRDDSCQESDENICGKDNDVNGSTCDKNYVNDSVKDNIKDNIKDNYNRVNKTVYLYNVHNIDAVLKEKAVKRVYIDFDIFYTDRSAFYNACEKVNKADTDLYIGLPYILSQENHDRMNELLDDLCMHDNICVQGYLVKNLEEIGLLARRRIEKQDKPLTNGQPCEAAESSVATNRDIITDAGVYTFNTYSADEIKDIVKHAGLSMNAYTLPYELNSTELRSVMGTDSELVVYAKVPAMISKQCVRKTYGRCNHKNSTTLLRQGNGKEYAVKSVCSLCYTVTRADVFDISKEKALDDMVVGTVRYEFDNESEEQIHRILNQESDVEYKGHFYRGVN